MSKPSTFDRVSTAQGIYSCLKDYFKSPGAVDKAQLNDQGVSVKLHSISKDYDTHYIDGEPCCSIYLVLKETNCELTETFIAISVLNSCSEYTKAPLIDVIFYCRASSDKRILFSTSLEYGDLYVFLNSVYALLKMVYYHKKNYELFK